MSTPHNNDEQDRPSLETPHRGLLMIAVMGVTMIQLLDVTIANVALPHMRSSFGASMDTITWVLTSYIIAGVMVTPIVGWLSDRVGSRRLFLAAVAGFLLASMLCGAATSLAQMVFFRSLQGVCAAFIGPMSQTILFDINRPSRQAAAMSIWGIVVMIAPISGPMVGGFLTDSLNWRWIFFVNLPIGIPTLLALIWLLPSRPLMRRRLDITGFCMIAIGLVALQLVLDRGHHKDWLNSTEIVIELLIVSSAFWMFAVHSLTTENTLFPRALLRNPGFLAGLCLMFILGVANVAIVSLLPLMFQNVYNYSALDTGLLLAPRGIGIAITMLITTRIIGQVDSRYLISSGFLLAGAAMWAMSHWSLEMGRMPIITSGFLQGLGLGFIFTPINLIAFTTLAPQYRPDGASLLNLMRNIGGSFGISFIVTMLARNTQTSHADLAASITPFNLPDIDIGASAERLGDFGTTLLQLIDAEINRQALMIAYIDNFHVMAILVTVVAFAVFLLKPMRYAHARPSASAE